MKVFLLALLAALLGVERAHSLVCFCCMNKNSKFYCLKPTICSDSDNYCMVISASGSIRNVVDFGYTLNKGCLLPDWSWPERQSQCGVCRHPLLPELPV